MLRTSGMWYFITHKHYFVFFSWEQTLGSGTLFVAAFALIDIVAKANSSGV